MTLPLHERLYNARARLREQEALVAKLEKEARENAAGARTDDRYELWYYNANSGTAYESYGTRDVKNKPMREAVRKVREMNEMAGGNSLYFIVRKDS